MDRLLVLYASCIPVRGASRSAICDLQREQVHLIPNSLYDLFDADRCLPVDKLKRTLAEGLQLQVLGEYITWLEEEELAFFCTEAEAAHYPALSPQWLFPAEISNCIIDVAENTAYISDDLFAQLEDLCCNYIQFRFWKPVDHTWLKGLMDRVHESQVKSIDLVIADYEDEGYGEWPEQLITAYPKIQSVVVHSCNACDSIPLKVMAAGVPVRRTAEKLSALHCGLVSSDYFAINIPAYTESLQHNSCLNRKISIDAEGYIRNCPSMQESFGHINNTRLREAMEHPAFTRYWHMNKDQVAVCRDCEFRYICTDCRAYVEHPGKNNSKPLKCGYDPYTGTWQEWANVPLKQYAIRHYGIRP